MTINEALTAIEDATVASLSELSSNAAAESVTHLLRHYKDGWNGDAPKTGRQFKLGVLEDFADTIDALVSLQQQVRMILRRVPDEEKP